MSTKKKQQPKRSPDVKMVTFGLRPLETAMLKELQEQDLGITEIFRNALRAYHRKVIPVYARSRDKDDDKTPEQKCVDIGGTIVEKDGVMVCEYKVDQVIMSTPIDRL